MDKLSVKSNNGSLGEKSTETMMEQEGLGYKFIVVNRPYLPPVEDRIKIFREEDVGQDELKEWKESKALTVTEVLENDMAKKLKELFD